MKRFHLGLIGICAFALACGGSSGDDGNMATPGTPDAGAPGGGGGGAATEATTLSLQVGSRSTDGEMGQLAGAKIFIEPFSSPEAANPKPHVYFEREPDAVTDAAGNVTLEVAPSERHVVHIVADGYGSLMRLIEPADRSTVFVLTMQELHRTTINLPTEGEVELFQHDGRSRSARYAHH